MQAWRKSLKILGIIIIIIVIIIKNTADLSKKL